MITTDKIKAYVLVAIQFACILLIVVFGKGIARQGFWLALEMAGLALAAWAFITMGWRNLHAAPLVSADARLVTNGPYRYIRHPMYSAVLMVIWALILDDYAPWRMFAGVALAIDLVVKLLYEERLLQRHFPEYEAYMKTTKRLVPFIL